MAHVGHHDPHTGQHGAPDDRCHVMALTRLGKAIEPLDRNLPLAMVLPRTCERPLAPQRTAVYFQVY